MPYLLVFSSVLLGAEGPVRAFLARRVERSRPTSRSAVGLPIVFGTFASSVYGGYFGAGLGIMLLALMGLFFQESLLRLNALKQGLSFVISLVAAIFLAVTAHVAWNYVAVLAPCAVVGGSAGGKLVRVVPAGALRLIVVLVGIAVAIRYWV